MVNRLWRNLIRWTERILDGMWFRLGSFALKRGLDSKSEEVGLESDTSGGICWKGRHERLSLRCTLMTKMNTAFLGVKMVLFGRNTYLYRCAQ